MTDSSFAKKKIAAITGVMQYLKSEQEQQELLARQRSGFFSSINIPSPWAMY